MGFLNLLKSIVGKQNWDYAERRGKMRAKCRIEASLVVSSGLIGADVLNISVTGMLLQCLGKVRKGEQVQLRSVKQHNQATNHSLNCRIEWTKKNGQGWLAGVSFLDSAQEMGKSWLYWELKGLGLRMIGADQQRQDHRVRCLLPSRLTSRSQNLNARTINLSPSGALVQTTGKLMEVGEIVTLRFGPLDTLPKISAKANIASLPVEGAPTYGLRFMTFEAGTPAQLKLYLDFFFKE